jgi:DNA-binding NtrC family response regulator
MTEGSSPVSSAAERRVRCLLVDDEPVLLRAMRRVILQRRPNWELCLATSAESALRVLAEKVFDCVMSDLHMPEVDGVRLLELVGERFPRCARVAHSSHIETIGRDKVGSVCDFMLQKPAAAELVIETLERASQISRSTLSERLVTG